MPVDLLACLTALTAACLDTTSPLSPRAAWLRYPTALLLLTWGLSDATRALLILVVSLSIGLLVLGRRLASAYTVRQRAEWLLSRMVAGTVTLLTAEALTRLLETPAPLVEWTPQAGAGWLVALVSAWLVALVISQPLFGSPEENLDPPLTRQLVGMLVLNVTVLALCLVAAQAQPGVFPIILFVLSQRALRIGRLAQTEVALMKRLQELTLLTHISENLSSSLVVDDLLSTLARSLRQLLGADGVIIALTDAEQATVSYPLVWVNGSQMRLPASTLSNSSVRAIMRHPGVLQIADPKQWAALGADQPPLTNQYPYMLGIRLAAGKTTIGAILLADKHAALLSRDNETTLRAIAAQAGFAVQNALLYARSLRLVENLSLINAATQHLMVTLSRSEAGDHLCQIALTIAEADCAVLYIIQHGVLVRINSIGLDEAVQADYERLALTDLNDLSNRTLADTSAPNADPRLAALAKPGGFSAVTLMPMRTSSLSAGALALFYYKPHHASRTELSLLEMFSSQISSIIDNAELFQALETYAFEMAQLAHLSRASTTHLDLSEVAHDVALVMAQIVNMPRVTIALVSENEDETMRLNTVTSTADAADGSQPVVVEQLVLPEISAILNDAAPALRTFNRATAPADLQTLMTHTGEQTLVITPMITNNAPLGAILLGTPELRTLSDREHQLLEMATNQVAIHLQNALLYTSTREALRQRLEQLAVIEDIARQISSALDANHIRANILDAAARSTQAEFVALALLSEGDAQTVLIECYADGSYSVLNRVLNQPNGILERVLTSGARVSVGDRRLHDGTPADAGVTPFMPDARAAVAVPLVREGIVIGVLDVESRRPNFFSQAHGDFLANLAGHAVISIGNADMLEAQKHQVRVLGHLQALALRLSGAVNTHAVAEAVLNTATGLLECTSNDPCRAALFNYDALSSHFEVLATQPPNQVFTAADLPPLATEAAQTGTYRIEEHSVYVPLLWGGRTRHLLVVRVISRRSVLRELDSLLLLASQAAGHLENATLHEQMRAILNSTREGMLLFDQKGRIVEVNPASRALLGEGLVRYIEEIGHTVGGTAAPTPDLVVRRQLEQKTRRGVLYLEETSAPVFDAGRHIGWLLALRDVTEEKLLSDYRDEITQMVVHDLRGPLGAVISGIQMSLDDVAPDSWTGETLQLAADSANRMMTLVDSLLDIAKLEARELLIHPQTVTVEALVYSAVETLRHTIQQANLTLTIDLPPDLPPVSVDEELIRRVVINLLDNAVRFTPARKALLLQAEPAEAGWVCIRVADSGSGIPPEERERIFDKFKQGKNSERLTLKRGTGLGLTFCKLAVEAHGGYIRAEVESPLGGASFAFTLPTASR